MLVQAKQNNHHATYMTILAYNITIKPKRQSPKHLRGVIR